MANYVYENQGPLTDASWWGGGTELEIDIVGIWKRALAILTFRLQRPELEELDLAGPILFAVLLACTHLLVGRPACVLSCAGQTCRSA